MKQLCLITILLLSALFSSAQEKKTTDLKYTYTQDSYLDANTINALISSHGLHFFNGESAAFEYPKGSGKQLALWTDMLLTARCGSSDYIYNFGNLDRSNDYRLHTGPISNNYSQEERKKWEKGTWKISWYDVDFHKENWQTQNYVPSEIIKNWPANGNPAYGQMPVYAPFFDRNQNGLYEPLEGDYPEIRGDQSIFFVCTDSVNDFNEPVNNAMGLEVLGMAYAYDMISNDVLHNSIFFHYDIVNRSPRDYKNVYTGFMFDADIGDANDDYFGTDVKNGMIYMYNGDNFDGEGQSWTYGENPPAIGMKIMGGPFLPADGIDNPAGNCSYDINGMNFGDEIVDNERFGMTNSLYPVNEGIHWLEYGFLYKKLRGLWDDGTHLTFGGNGHISSGAVGPDCNFMFPDQSDTLCNWGTGGILPNGGYNQNGYFWNEESTGNAPGDRRGIGSIGPFNLNSGESFQFDIAFTVAQSENGALASRNRLYFNANYIGNNAKNIICVCSPTYGKEDPENRTFKVYPNPAKDQIVVISDNKNPHEYSIYNLTGSVVQTGMLIQGNNQLNISSLKPGFYMIKSGLMSTKFIVQ